MLRASSGEQNESHVFLSVAALELRRSVGVFPYLLRVSWWLVVVRCFVAVLSYRRPSCTRTGKKICSRWRRT